MRKIAPLFTVLMLLCALAFGQARTVTGTVRDENGNPIPYASVTITGTQTGTTADANGNYSIEIKQNGRLTFTATGFQTHSIAPNGNIFNLTLKRGEGNLQEVVVTTALGLRRNKNTLPYAAQTIKGDDVSQTRSGNFVSGLSGKVSGVEIRQGNAMGASTNVVIRGTKSLLNSNQAMFVVDGVPIDNSNNSTDNTKTGRGGFDYGNAAADINPDDIESLTVLKGAAATALYGSRAANGVVMVTTKKGRKGLGITVNSGVTVGAIDKSTYAKYQKEYGADYTPSAKGYGSPDKYFLYFDVNGDGVKDEVVPTTEDASYGAKFDPNRLVYHWDAFDAASPYYKKARPWVGAENDPVSFFERAVSTNNSVSIDGGNDKGSFKLGYTRNEEKGVLPNSKLLKNLVNFGSTYRLTEQLTAAGSLNFSNIQGTGRYGTGYDDWNVNQQFRQWWQTNVDIKELKEAYFRNRQNITWNWADPSKASGLYPIYSDNPYFARYENYEQDERYRYFGNASLNYTPTNWLNILGRVSLDSYNELQEERFAVGSNAPSAYKRFNRTFSEYNYDLMANFNKDINEDFNLKAVLGTNIRRTNINSIRAETNGGLVVPGLYSLAMSKNPINAPVEIAEAVATDGYFGSITLGYKNYLTLDATARQDRSSTLPKGNNSYFYPSISGSFLFSKFLSRYTWLSSGKLRANYAQVGNSAPWGSLQDIYDKPNPFGTATLFSLPNTKNNAELKPEKTNSYEIGLEAAFLRSRLGFDVTYYNTKSIDQIIPVAVSYATGYSSKYVNAGTVVNKGVELSIYATVVQTPNFSWTTNINWTSNRNKVVALYDSSKNLQVASFQGGVSINAKLGEPYGSIQGKTWQTLNGEKLVGSNGRYAQTSTTDNVIGNINPDWTGGIYNTFKYKNVSLGFLVDVRQGGDVFSLDMYYGLATGLYPETAGLNDLGKPSRNTVADGGGVIMQGVTADGKPNTKRVENIYGTYGYSYNPAANFVYDASYVKLREANITYSFPSSMVSKLKVFKGIDLSIIGRNLWIIHKNLPYADPEENLTSGNAQGYQSGAYPTTRTIGANLKLKF
ncbi:SusC/RagA family TonB-linked outer membrane protein [Chitinophagaceae bacterium LB-8]|uniref:SusC/RagA family TonB-linked outer membrane protein n=1 Tax=Paraflavisolibacter caeni TaxID=2982496 RepID=A0A9X2XUB7_9BACT|nr:SusC/RagA family TonB-linked outer membrane protein [Paraflavisolibacter caeni]MCU7548637.1 SusC/RagA family TonB-linked outer membrane protein [Paraflavisolibacter caeni]